MIKNKNDREYESKHCQRIRFSYNHQELSKSKESREGSCSYFCKEMQNISEFFTSSILLYPLYTENGEEIHSYIDVKINQILFPVNSGFLSDRVLTQSKSVWRSTFYQPEQRFYSECTTVS